MSENREVVDPSQAWWRVSVRRGTVEQMQEAVEPVGYSRGEMIDLALWAFLHRVHVLKHPMSDIVKELRELRTRCQFVLEYGEWAKPK